MKSVVLLLALVCVPAASERPSLVSELASYSFKDGVYQLRSGRGWLRSRDVHLDFRVAFEYRATTPETDAALVVRAWTGTGGWPDRGYRLALPTAARAAASVFVGRQELVTVVTAGRVDLRPADEWQALEVVGRGQRVTITLNGALVGVFEVETFGGFLMFENRKGRIELKNLTMSELEPEFAQPQNVVPFKALKRSGGREPKLVREVKPFYTADALRRLVRGNVGLEAVVLPDGSVGEIRITRSLDRDLDKSAIAALRGWRFQPGTLDGREVAVLVEVSMSFTLK